MARKVILGVGLVVLVFAALAGVKALQIGRLMEGGKAFVPPPETVSSAIIREEKWPDTLSAVGSISAAQGVMIAAEIPGMVSEIAFESGAFVIAGAVLVKLDAASEEAQLRALDAQVEWALTNLARIKSLRADNTVSQSELDVAETALKQNQANADAVRAGIAKKTIRAPFAGRLGIRQVNIGQYVEAARAVVSLQSLAPVYGDFSLPQQELARMQTGLRVRATTDAYPGQVFEGALTAVNPDLDPVTRSVRAQATFENQEHRLRPGMFARMEVLLPDERPVLAIPATAILSAPYGDSVYLIESTTNSPASLVVRQQFIRVGRTRGDFASVVSGLKSGDRVVSSGVFKLRNGMSVVENNALTPRPVGKPKPAEG
jgi:membrane fusion protein (multidrug efflux system)